MVAMASMAYPIATSISHTHKPQNPPTKPTIKSSIPVPSSPQKLTKRRNYLRQKILKTLTKPYPLSPPTSENPITPIELIDPNHEFELPTSEKMDLSIIQDSELSFEQGVQASEVSKVESFNWFSSRTVVRIAVSFVGLFILQTVVAVWLMGTGDSDDNDRNLGIEGKVSGVSTNARLGLKKGEMGLNGKGILGNWVSQNVGGELEMEAKIAEIRKMAREARELEKKKKAKSGDVDAGDVGDDDDDNDVESDSPRIKSGIVEEVDGKLSKLRMKSSSRLVNVNLLKKLGNNGKEGKDDEYVDGKEEDNMLMFERKHRFRSDLTTPRDKPKGFQTIESSANVREKPRDTGEWKQVEMTRSDSENGASSSIEKQEINGLGSGLPERSNIGLQTDEKKPGTQSSGSLQASAKGFGSNGTTKKLNQSQASKKTSRSNSATKKSDKKINGGAEPQRGVVQDSNHGMFVVDGANSKDTSIAATQVPQRKMSDEDASTMSKTHVMSLQKGQLNSDRLGSREKDTWWFTLPYVLVILMQNGTDNEGEQGFFTVKIFSDETQSYTPYIVGFEDLVDAKNFRYLLESCFEELPDVAIDIVPISAKELREFIESLNKKVIVLKKGELRLYAGQPLAEVESALGSLVK